MSRIATKKISRTPVRSPSPDTVHKNINARTSSPLNEALMKQRLAKSFKSPIGKGFLNTEQYDDCIRSLEEQNRRLSKENSTLHEQNMRSLKQIDFLKEINLKSRKQLYKRSQPQFLPQHDVYNQYETRIGDLIVEIRRIQDLLSKEIKKNEVLIKQNEQLITQRELSAKLSLYEEARLKKQLNDIQDKLNEAFQQKIEEYQRKVELVLNDEIKKVNKLENSHTILRNLFQNRKNDQSPTQIDRSAKQYSTYTPSNKANKQENILKGSNSSEEYNRRQGQIIQCEKCRFYLIRIAELQGKLNVRQFQLSYSSKNGPQADKYPLFEEYLHRLAQIKFILNNEEIKTSIDCIDTNLNDIYSINQKFQYMTAQKNKVIQELREKEIKQAIELISLKKENGMLKVQINEQCSEISKLQELITTEVASFRKDSQSQIRPKENNSISEADVLRKCLEQAVSRIQTLQNHMQASLKPQIC